MMDWQQAVSLGIVATAAALLVGRQVRAAARRRRGGCGGECCGADVRRRIAQERNEQGTG